MAQDSKIQWTHHTFNPWWGCEKPPGSPECDHCYAESFAKRVGQKVWGPLAPRRFFGDKHWQEPLKWEKAARDAGERHRVFCASMADVFEDRPDLVEHRYRLLCLIAATPNLDWLLLTKRPQHVMRLVTEIADGWRSSCEMAWWWSRSVPPRNVWVGTTCGSQASANVRLPQLLEIPAEMRFLSCEPLLGPVILDDALNHPLGGISRADGIDWVICGGESGQKARPMQVDWARWLRHECKLGGISFFMKQLGGTKSHRGELEDFPEDLRVREFPQREEVAA